MTEIPETIIRQVQAGNHQPFEEIVKLYQSKIYNLAYRMTYNREDALDLCQEIFFRIYQKIKYFEGGNDFLAWCYKVGFNVCLNWKKRHKVKTVSLEALSYGNASRSFEIPDDKNTPLETLSKHIDQQEVKKAIDELPTTYRLITTLRYLEDMPYGRIAEITGSPIGTIKNSLFRAREFLKQKLLKSKEE